MPPRHLVCHLVCEGNSDRWFFPPLFKRAVEALCQGRNGPVVEVEVSPLWADHQRPDDILRALAAADRFDVLLYHHDGAPVASAEAKVAEVTEAVRAVRKEPVVPVVPLRETEAWLIADPDALADALGLAPAVVAGLLPTRPRDSEAVFDPKALLNEAARATGRRGSAERFRDRRPGLFADLADRIDLTRLRQVPSFERWWTDMNAALDHLGYQK
jgi:hypothetical protein